MGKKPPATPGPLRLVEPQTSWAEPQANAVIPPVARTASDFVPVYLSDEALAHKERAMVTPGNAVAHEKIEADRR